MASLRLSLHHTGPTNSNCHVLKHAVLPVPIEAWVQFNLTVMDSNLLQFPCNVHVTSVLKHAPFD